MSKSIPITLQGHYDEPVNTTSFLLLVWKNTGHAGAEEKVGFHSHDIDLDYDPGTGSVTFKGTRGFDPSALENTADLSVDNCDAMVLLDASSLDAVTVEEIDAGRFDSAAFELYQANWKDLTMGHELVHFGTIGEARVIGNGLACMFELRGQSQQFKQNIGYRDTRDCPARFGSQPGEERLYCGFDATTLLIEASVTTPGAENTRTFTASSLTQDPDHFVPGMVFWKSGRNAGTAQEVESFSGAVVSLRFDTPYPIAENDLFDIREDCSKKARDAEKGCLRWFGAQWVFHFRGCPDIPTADAARISTPGASVPSANTGTIGEVMDP